MGAADYVSDGWGGTLLTCESVVQRTASFDDEAGGAIGSCGGGSSWGRYGRNTTCWRCCQSRACSTKPPKTKRYPPEQAHHSEGHQPGVGGFQQGGADQPP